MKIRWMNGSLRLRVSPSEFASLQNGDAVTEVLGAPGRGQWAATCVVGDVTAIEIVDGNLTFTVSHSDMERFAAPDAEGVYFSDESDLPFKYYVEKNFPCAHPHAPEACAMDAPLGTFVPPAAFEARKQRAGKRD